MRKLVYYVGVSIDGYIAGPGDEVNFYPLSDDMAGWINARYPETVPTHLRSMAGLEDEPNRAFDTVVMGRRTYYPALAISITSPYSHLRQYVVSRSITIDDPTVTLADGDPIELVRRLKAEDGDKDIWLCGGGTLAGSLLPEIDELIVKSYPVVAGEGISMFGGRLRPTNFVPTRRESFDNAAQVTWFASA